MSGYPEKSLLMQSRMGFLIEDTVMEILVGLVAAIVATLIVRGLLVGTARPVTRRHSGEYVSPSYRARVARQCRNEFDANRIMASK